MTRPLRFHDGLRLVATQSAISCAGLLVVSTLTKWGARSVLLESVKVTEELVTNAVTATAVMEKRVNWNELTRIEYLTVRLLGFDTSVRIEVWDSDPCRPLLPNETSSPNQFLEPLAEQFRSNPDLLRRVRDGLDEL